jgi:hypothetical protein
MVPAVLLSSQIYVLTSAPGEFNATTSSALIVYEARPMANPDDKNVDHVDVPEDADGMNREPFDHSSA